MFVFQLSGGVGNQMFQYAAARALSLARGIPFKVDFDCPNKRAANRYMLGVFALHADFATPGDLRTRKPIWGLRRRIYRLLGVDPDYRLVREKRDFHFDPEFFAIPDGAYVSGYWQSERYFSDIAADIRRDFVFRDPPSRAYHPIVDSIRSCAAPVSLHVRRGDYVSVAATHDLHGTCTPEYYERAVAHIRTRVGDPTFYVFSDDIAWARQNLRIDGRAVFVGEGGPGPAHEDMRAMSLCAHHIIANSSFSWWGAWLGANAAKIVVAPATWMASERFTTPDLLPQAWAKL